MTSSRPRSREYRGSCHCGALGFVYRTALELKDWPVRACQCTFCRAHGGLTTSDPEGSLVFIEHEPAMLHRYQFGKRITDFLICRRCGAYIGAAMPAAGKGFGVVNVRALPSVFGQLPKPQPMDYDNETRDGRVARREQRWTPLEADRREPSPSR
jgi:hypothetical protein